MTQHTKESLLRLVGLYADRLYYERTRHTEETWYDRNQSYAALEAALDEVFKSVDMSDKQWQDMLGEPVAWTRSDAIDAAQDFRFIEIEDFTTPLYAPKETK
jgi:hypothetical protein